MSLIVCNECGKEISDRATVCPNCGAPTELSDKIAIGEAKESMANRYKAKQFLFQRKITRLILISLCFGLIFFLIGASTTTIKGKLLSVFAWFITILLLYNPVIKENGSIVVALVKAFFGGWALIILASVTILLGGELANLIGMPMVGAGIVAALWGIGLIGALLSPIFDIVDDVKELKALKKISE